MSYIPVEQKKGDAQMLLEQYARRYAGMVDASHGYFVQIRAAIRSATTFAGRDLYPQDLTTQFIHDWTLAVRDTLAPPTRRTRRNVLIRLARFASKDTALRNRPSEPIVSDIPRVKVGQVIPRAWSIDQARQLLAAAQSLRGKYRNGVPKRAYWTAYILTVWDAGWRGCDVRSLERGWINESGRLAIVQVKTKKVVYAQLRPKTLAAIADLLTFHDSAKVFPHWCNHSAWRRAADRLIKKAGLTGAMGRLRASAGTAAENANPGKGYQFLGNTPDVFYRHYYDRTLGGEIIQPPEL